MVAFMLFFDEVCLVVFYSNRFYFFIMRIISISSKLVSPSTLAMPPPSRAVTQRILVTKDKAANQNQTLRQMR